MTKEQLIELIQTSIPDGSLVNIRIGSDMYNVSYIDDDTQIGLWNICCHPAQPDYYADAIRNGYRMNEAGIKATSIFDWKKPE